MKQFSLYCISKIIPNKKWLNMLPGSCGSRRQSNLLCVRESQSVPTRMRRLCPCTSGRQAMSKECRYGDRASWNVRCSENVVPWALCRGKKNPTFTCFANILTKWDCCPLPYYCSTVCGYSGCTASDFHVINEVHTCFVGLCAR